MQAAGEASIALVLTFHIDLPRAGRGQPFPVVCLAAEQRRFIKTCGQKTEDLLDGPAQNAQVTPKALAAAFLALLPYVFVCQQHKRPFNLHSSFPFCDPAHHLPRRQHECAVGVGHGTAAGPYVSTLPLHNLLSKHLFVLQKGKGRKQKSPPPRLESDDLLLAKDCSNLPDQNGELWRGTGNTGNTQVWMAAVVV